MNGDEPHRVNHLRSLSEAARAPHAESAHRTPAHLFDARVATGDERNGAAPEGGAEEAISNTIFHLLRVHAGRAPTTARTVLTSNLAVVMVRDCLTTVERTLAGEGHGALAMEVRTALHDAIRTQATAAVEEITGRPVVAYLTDQHREPDLAIIAFVFAAPQPPSHAR